MLTGTGFGTCPADSHRHALILDDKGKPMFYRFSTRDFPTLDGQPVQPDIIMDGLCHDNNTEAVEDESQDLSRKKLPKPHATPKS